MIIQKQVAKKEKSKLFIFDSKRKHVKPTYIDRIKVFTKNTHLNFIYSKTVQGLFGVFRNSRSIQVKYKK